MDLFGTAGIRGDATEEVTPELALAVGRAVGLEARERGVEEFVLGRDGRVTGRALVAAAEAGLTSAGAAVRHAGVLPTPALAYASRSRGGVMLTASHNPPGDNGIKLFADGVEYDRDLEQAVSGIVADDRPPVAWDAWGDVESTDPLADYLEAVVAYARNYGAALDGLRVVVDCGNGMASLATPQVLRMLGADVATLNASVDGHFPGRGSKPTPESLADLRAFVADDADTAFGIGHDGDADRIVIVDADGEIVHEDTVLAILAEHFVRASTGGNSRTSTDGDSEATTSDCDEMNTGDDGEMKTGDDGEMNTGDVARASTDSDDHVDVEDPVVVTTPNASARIDERVREAGGRVERVRLGALHEGIAAAEAAGGDVVFAAEPWKHVHPAFGGWIDGVASAAVLARLVASEGLSSLRAPVSERPYRKVNIPCPDDAKAATMDRLRTRLPEAFAEAAVETEHGIRLERPDGSWLLVRPSGTEPYVRLYAESDRVDELVATATAAVEAAVDAVTED